MVFWVFKSLLVFFFGWLGGFFKFFVSFVSDIAFQISVIPVVHFTLLILVLMS